MAKWDCGAFGIRLIIMVFNLILVLGGTYVMAPMLTLLLYAKPLQELFGETGLYAVFAVIGLGLCWVMVGVTGWFGSCVTKNKTCLTFNLILALSLLISEIALVAVMFPALSDYKGLELGINNTLQERFSQYGLNRTQLDLHDVQHAEGVDFIQRWWQCCGYVGIDDWSNTTTSHNWPSHGNNSNNGNHGNGSLGNYGNSSTVPDSCCVQETRGCGLNMTHTFHSQGCYSGGYDFVSSKALPVLVFLAVILSSQVCIILCGVKLCRRLPANSAYKHNLKEKGQKK